MNKKESSFFYTSPQMVEDLLAITPIERADSVLDAGSGRNKIWFKKLTNYRKYECEIEDGNDFMKWSKKVDWVVGNPPFQGSRDDGKKTNLIPAWINKASTVAEKGMAFLINHKVINFLTPARLDELSIKGFYLTRIHIVADKRWFGRYYYLIFTKKNNNLVSWCRKTY